jgi:hypothetical protein
LHTIEVKETGLQLPGSLLPAFEVGFERDGPETLHLNQALSKVMFARKLFLGKNSVFLTHAFCLSGFDLSALFNS